MPLRAGFAQGGALLTTYHPIDKGRYPDQATVRRFFQ